MKTSVILVALTGGLAAVVACSSSSSTPTNDNEGDAGSSSGASSSGSSSSSSSGGLTVPNIQTTCMSAADCTDAGAGAVCCFSLNGITPMTACQVAACTPLEGMSTQLCKSSTECTVAPDTQCAASLIPGYSTCQPASATTPDAGGSGGVDAASSDAAPADAAAVDAPTGD